MNITINKFIGFICGLTLLLFTCTACFEDSWCDGFQAEPYIFISNANPNTAMLTVESDQRQLDPLVLPEFRSVRIPFDMNKNLMKIHIQRGNEQGTLAIRYTFEAIYCDDHDNYHLQFKSLRPDHQLSTFKKLSYDYELQQNVFHQHNDGAVLHKMRQEEEQHLNFPLIYIQ